MAEIFISILLLGEPPAAIAMGAAICHGLQLVTNSSNTATEHGRRQEVSMLLAGYHNLPLSQLGGVMEMGVPNILNPLLMADVLPLPALQ